MHTQIKLGLQCSPCKTGLARPAFNSLGIYECRNSKVHSGQRQNVNWHQLLIYQICILFTVVHFFSFLSLSVGGRVKWQVCRNTSMAVESFPELLQKLREVHDHELEGKTALLFLSWTILTEIPPKHAWLYLYYWHKVWSKTLFNIDAHFTNFINSNNQQ